MKAIKAYPYTLMRCAMLFSVYTAARPVEIRSVMSHFGLKVYNRHRAIGDCIATELIYERLQEEALLSYSTLQDFAVTFKAYTAKQLSQTVQIGDDTLEEWKQELYTCPSVYKAFKFFDRLKLKKLSF